MTKNYQIVTLKNQLSYMDIIDIKAWLYLGYNVTVSQIDNNPWYRRLAAKVYPDANPSKSDSQYLDSDSN